MSTEILEKRHALAYLQDIQKQNGYISKESIIKLAEDLDVPVADLYAIATFYKALSLKPRGKHTIKVCDGTACHIRGSVRLLDIIENELGIGPDDTTEDMMFTLDVVNCLGACALAPAMTIDDDYYGGVHPDKLPEILASYKNNKAEAVKK